MPKLRRNQKLTCLRCGRVVTVNSVGVSRGTIWCCSRPMQQKSKAAPKKRTVKRKTTKKRTAKRRTVKRKGVRKKTARRTAARRRR